jgi:glycosyltransferase involved in cell wall biosynthesis
LIPKVNILLGCFSGAKYITEQLDSIESQTHKNWCVYASDDGSADETLDILKAYQVEWGSNKLVILQGPCKGFCQNFLSMVCNPKIIADYYAFCDQDDIWLPEKLTAAIHCLSMKDSSLPYIYGGRTTYVDINLKKIEDSPNFIYPTSFRNALVQNIAGGNTMVFNHAAKTLVTKVGIVDAVAHDWWLYILIMGYGGRMYFDSRSYILYRQHPEALIGKNNSFMCQFIRFMKLLKGEYKEWNDQNIGALKLANSLLNYNNRKTLDQFILYRNSNLIRRIRMISVCGLYRQGWHGEITLFLAALFKRI